MVTLRALKHSLKFFTCPVRKELKENRNPDTFLSFVGHSEGKFSVVLR